MPIKFLHGLTSKQRTRRANRQLGGVLAFVAGAVNAGGFLAVQRYTSHMTGLTAMLADSLVLGSLDIALLCLTGLLSFVVGAAMCALLFNWARRRGLQSRFAIVLLLDRIGARLVEWMHAAGAVRHRI